MTDYYALEENTLDANIINPQSFVETTAQPQQAAAAAAAATTASYTCRTELFGDDVALNSAEPTLLVSIQQAPGHVPGVDGPYLAQRRRPWRSSDEQEHESARDNSASVPSPLRVRDAGGAFIARRLTAANERYEMWKERTYERCVPRLERLYAARTRLRNTCCGLVALAVVLFAVSTYTSDPGAFVVDDMRPTYARHGHNGVDLTRAASDVSCDEMRTGLGRLRFAIESLIRADQLSCACAPMIGVSRRYIAVRTSNTSIDHMYNPSLDATWDGVVDASTRIELSQSLVTENQRMLFPERVAAVTVVRANAVRLAYRDADCRTAALVLRDEHAWCVQACMDLLAGYSVYDRAVDDDAVE